MTGFDSYGKASSTAGSMALFILNFFDEYGKALRSSRYSSVIVQSSSPGAPTFFATDNGDGTFSVEFKPMTVSSTPINLDGLKVFTCNSLGQGCNQKVL